MVTGHSGQSDNNNLLDCSRHAPWPGQAGGGAAYDSNKMGGVRTEGGAGGGWRAAGGRPRAVHWPRLSVERRTVVSSLSAAALGARVTRDT